MFLFYMHYVSNSKFQLQDCQQYQRLSNETFLVTRTVDVVGMLAEYVLIELLGTVMFVGDLTQPRQVVADGD